MMFAEEIIKKQATQISKLESLLQNALKLSEEYNCECKQLKMRCEQYAQAYDSLLAQIKELQRYRFGKKSERFI